MGCPDKTSSGLHFVKAWFLEGKGSLGNVRFAEAFSDQEFSLFQPREKPKNFRSPAGRQAYFYLEDSAPRSTSDPLGELISRFTKYHILVGACAGSLLACSTPVFILFRAGSFFSVPALIGAPSVFVYALLCQERLPNLQALYPPVKAFKYQREERLW